jgi:hypothetical protein
MPLLRPHSRFYLNIFDLKLTSKVFSPLLSKALSLEALYAEWKTGDKVFSKKGILPGIRSLDQDPVENIFSFICTV